MLTRLSWLTSACFAYLLIVLVGGLFGENIHEYFDDWAPLGLIAFSVLWIPLTLIVRYLVIGRVETDHIESSSRSEDKETSSADAVQSPLPAVSPLFQTSSVDMGAPVMIALAPEEVIQEETRPGFSLSHYLLGENPLSRIGTLLIVLGLLFFLSLVWAAIGEVGRLVLAFVISFALYGSGMIVHKKGYSSEGMGLMSAGIVGISASVLTGRWLLGDRSGIEGIEANLIGDGLALFLLALTAAGATLTAIVYRSGGLMVFSSLLFYSVPYLTASTESTVIWIGYALLLHAGLSLLIRRESVCDLGIHKALSHITLLGTSLALVIGSWVVASVSWEYALTMASVPVMLLISEFIARSEKAAGVKHIITAYVLTLLCALPLFDNSNAEGLIVLTGVMAAILVPAAAMLRAWHQQQSHNPWFFVVPIILLLIVALAFPDAAVIVALALVALLLATFITLADRLSSLSSAFISGLASASLVSISALLQRETFSAIEWYTLLVAALVPYAYALYRSMQEDESTPLLVASTIGSGIILASIAKTSGEFLIPSVAALLVWSLAHLWSVGTLAEKKVSSLSFSALIATGLLMIIGEVIYYGNVYFSGVLLWFAVLFIAVIYGALMYRSTLNKASRDSVILLGGGAMSAVAVAIAYLFGDYLPGMSSAAWAVQAACLMYIAQRTGDMRIRIAASVVQVIALGGLTQIFDSVEKGAYLLLVPIIVFAAALLSSLSVLRSESTVSKTLAHDVLHLIGILALSNAVIGIVPSTGLGWSEFSIALILLALSPLYALTQSRLLSGAWIISSGIYALYITSRIDSIAWRIESLEVSWAHILLPFIASCAVIGALTVMYRRGVIFKSLSSILLAASAFLLSSKWVYFTAEHLLSWSETFALTFYWYLLATTFIAYGFEKQTLRYRTIGLYLIALATTKVILYDVWMSFSNAPSRVLALMVAGGLMLWASSWYTRRLGGASIMSEFRWGEGGSGDVGAMRNNAEKESSAFRADFAQTLASMDLSDIANVTLKGIDGKQVTLSRENSQRLCLWITQIAQKVNFAPGELLTGREWILERYDALSASSESLSATKDLEHFASTGGEILIEKK